MDLELATGLLLDVVMTGLPSEPLTRTESQFMLDIAEELDYTLTRFWDGDGWAVQLEAHHD